jgi:hypothetical protein
VLRAVRCHRQRRVHHEDEGDVRAVLPVTSNHITHRASTDCSASDFGSSPGEVSFGLFVQCRQPDQESIPSQNGKNHTVLRVIHSKCSPAVPGAVLSDSNRGRSPTLALNRPLSSLCRLTLRAEAMGEEKSNSS